MSDFNQENHQQQDLAQRDIAKIKRSFLGYLITHFRVIVLLMVTIFSLGLVAVFNIPRESDPEVKIPIAVVSTFYAGASPQDMEDLITDKIENKVEELDGVKLVTSSSISSVSSVVVEFEAEQDLDQSIRELKDKVAETNGLPDEAEDPVVTQVRANDFPLITFSLTGPLTESQLKQLGEIVQDELEAISGVSKAPLSGVRSLEYSVTVNKLALSRLRISLSQVIGAIQATNLDMPLGDIAVDDISYNLRAVSKLQSLEELKNVVVSVNNEQPVYLSDLAEIKEQFTESKSLSRISISGSEASSAVSLSVYKKTGGNILEIVDAAKLKIEKLQEENLIPDNVSVQVSSDYSSFVRDDLNTLGSSGIQATILIFLVMFIALSWKESIISLLAIPLTFLITLIILYNFDFTLNSMTLYALVLSLGLLVDTFIVVLEGIFHNMRNGHSSKNAALLSVAHYKLPLLSGILTTISAFVPMLLVSGILGEYLKIFPITIAITLTSSLFVSLVLVSGMSTVFLKRTKVDEKNKDSILEKYLTNYLRKKYRQNISDFLKNRKQKIKFLIVLLVLFFASLTTLFTGLVKVELFPKIDVEYIYVDINMPIGTELLVTDQVAREVEERLYENKEIKTFVTTVGQASSLGFFDGGGSGSSHVANVSITLVDEEERDLKSYQIAEHLREDLKDINEGEIVVKELTSGPPTGAPIEARISGHDLNTLASLAGRLEDLLKNKEGVINVDNNQSISPADFTFTLKKDAIAKYDLSVAGVASSLRTAIFGTTATEISHAGDDYDVVVKFDKNKFNTVEDIKNLSVLNNRGQEIKLASLADFSLQPALATIRHRDFERTVTVQADLRPGYNSAEISAELEKDFAAQIPTGYTVKFGGEVEDIDQSFSELWNAMIVAVLLIWIILVLQFNSFRAAATILMTLPLMMIGVVVGMLLLRLPFSFPVFLGLISLAGIVVNDAIVFIDKTERNIREKNMFPLEALADAGDTRLQPILLTSITTIFGVFPLALANEFWVGLSVSIIFGLAFATVLQLFVIPMVYLQLKGKKILRERKG
ncbi:efflux RND transporter permease subunit [Candidatus Nomurabacteria bacterium]|nr:efflux RND transporter permease subunit [Candidatus Nomurabacteria bacterium]